MRNIAIKNLFIFFVFLTVFTSCESINQEKDENIYLMIYDYESCALQNVEIYIDDECIGRSDVYGRFIISSLKDSENKFHNLTLKKEGYFEVKDEITFNPMSGLYYRMASSEQLMEVAEEEFDSNQNEKALDSIRKSLLVKENDDGFFLEALILKKMGKTEEMKKSLEKISDKTLKNKYSKYLEN